MTRILLWYITREMGKTFLLTATGLTLLLSLGGGIANLVKGEGLQGAEILQVLSFVIPGAVTLSLPVAGLFAATMTFGRLSADNELNACRAGGINVHALLAPVLCLAFVIAVVTFYFSNFVIPHYVVRLNELVGGNIFRLVLGELTTKRHFEFRGNVIHVDKIKGLDPGTKNEQGRPINRFASLGGAFMELTGSTPVRIATTQSLVAEFDQFTDPPRIRASLIGIRGIDLARGQFYETEEQPFGPIEVPRLSLSLKPKWMNLRQLVEYRRRPMDLPGIVENLKGLREEIRRILFYRAVAEGLKSDTGVGGAPPHTYRIGSDDRWYEVQAEKIATESATERPQLRNPKIIERMRDHTREISADYGLITAQRSPGQPLPEASIRLEGNVTITDSLEPGKPVQKPSWDLPPLPVPKDVLQQEAKYDDRTLMDAGQDLMLGRKIANARESLARDLGDSLRRMTAEIHSRTAFSVSVLATMILGAALGAVFRGAHVMTAFGISFAPALFVIAAVAMGRQVAQNPKSELAGILVIWTAIVLIAVLDVIVLRRYVRR